MDLNKAMLIGRVTQDPEARTTPSGRSVVNFGLATGRVWTDQQGQKQEKTEFSNIVAWQRLAEICGQYLRKGSKIYLEGRLETRTWDDQSGQRHWRTEIIAENMIMLDRKGDSSPASAASKAAPEDENPTYENMPPAPIGSTEKTPPKEEEINVEDIPF